MATTNFDPLELDRATLLDYVQTAVYLLAAVLALSLLIVGTVGVIAELKGTWHWQIHLQTTVSYVGVFVGYLLALLVPLFLVLVVGRLVIGDA
jgi:hypothetical protein